MPCLSVSLLIELCSGSGINVKKYTGIRKHLTHASTMHNDMFAMLFLFAF